MSLFRRVLVITLGLLAFACGGAAPPAEAPKQPEPAPAPKPEAPKPEAKAAPPEEKTPAPEEQPKSEPPAPAKPKSATQVGGASLSDVEGQAVVAAVQKLGWAPQDVTIMGGTIGRYENIRFGIAKDADEGYVEIIRPAQKPTGSSSSMMPPKDQKAMKEAEGGAVFLDEAADLLLAVIVNGKPAEAKKLLDKLVGKKK